MTPATDKFNQSIHRVLTNAVYNNVILLDVKDINESTVTAKTFCYNGVYWNKSFCSKNQSPLISDRIPRNYFSGLWKAHNAWELTDKQNSSYWGLQHNRLL